MAYQNVILPDNVLPEDERFVRTFIDPVLRELHHLFQIIVEQEEDWQKGCSFSVTSVLCNVISGISVEFCYFTGHVPAVGDTKGKFKQSLVQHYPWNSEPASGGALNGDPAADHLYEIYRGRITHNLGIIHHLLPEEAKLAMGALDVREIENIERARERPSDWPRPTLAEVNGELKLIPKYLYWGIRRMIYSIAEKRAADSAFVSPFDTLTVGIETSAGATTPIHQQGMIENTATGARRENQIPSRFVYPTDTSE